MADQNDSGLFREIDEELRQEHYDKLWKRYGSHVIALAVLLVVGVAGFQGWKSYDLNQRTESSNTFSQALRLTESNSADALNALSELSRTGSRGYAMLAGFREAELLAKNGRRDEAARRYRALSNDSGLDTLYQDMAAIMEAILVLNDAPSEDLNRRVSSLMADRNPWRHLAREVSALTQLKLGNIDKARELLTPLKDDQTAPETLRRRAEDLLKGLGS